MNRQQRDWSGWFVGALLLVHALCAAGAARHMSVTHDEYWHLPAGIAAWQSGRFDVDNLNPPLTRLWCAIPLAVESFDVDWKSLPPDAKALGDAFMNSFRGDAERYQALFFRARLMNVLLSLAVGLLLAWWAREWFGRAAGCVAPLLWCCCPTAVANAALVTPDTGATLLFVATLIAAWRVARQPGWLSCFALAVLLGLAQLAKFTNVLLFPLVVFVWWLARYRIGDCVVLPAKQWTLRIAAVIAVSLAVWNLGYLFQGSGATLGSYAFQSRAMQGLCGAFSWLSWCPVPLPRDYLEGLDHQRLVMEGDHPVFLDMEWRTDGFPLYFLKALEYKLPHAAQGLFLAGALVVVSSAARRERWREQAALLMPAAALIGLASFLRMQLGLRYILPALPLLYLYASQSGAWLDRHRYRWRSVVVGVACVLAPFSLRYHPHHLAYFNEYAGGPVEGRYHLLDSNLDWGQDLRELKSYLAKNRMPGVGLAYFGMVPPAFEGIAYQVPPSRAPLPGWYAVSVNFVMGRPHTVRTPDGSWRAADVDEFGYFRALEPVDRIGYSIDIYQVR